MKKIFLIMAALSMSAMMWATEITLTFDLSKNPGGWPTANSTTLKEYTYSLDDVDYSFNLKNVKCNSGYLMLTQPAALGLPDIGGYKLTKVVAKNSSGCSTSTKVGISYSYESADYLSGGEVQTWSTQSSSYTYSLPETSGNVVYYLYVTNKNAQITELALTYESADTPQRLLESIYIDGTATKLEYIEGESFDVAGLKVMGKYDDELGDSEITAGIDWIVTPDPLTVGTTSVSVTATAGGKVSDPKTIAVTVKEFVKTYANTYTSEVALTTEGGTSATAGKVIIGGTEYNAIKAGTSSTKGACVVTIPAATKTLHFHAAGWNGESVTLDVNGTEYTLVADAGVTSNSPFTLQNDPEKQDYFTFDPKGATTITFTASETTAGKRFVLFGVNAELGEGIIVSAPSFTPSNGEFDGSVDVTLSAEEGAEIFYAYNEAVIIGENDIKYTEPIELIETTTIYAIAKKNGKESEMVSKTYTLIPSFESLEALVTGLPATSTNTTVKVTITDAPIDSFYVTKQGYKNGVFTHVGDAKVELYEYNVPATWEVGGTLSGTIIGQWSLYNGIPELQQWEKGWNAFQYSEPASITVNVTVPEGTPACYFYGEMSGNTFVEMDKVDDTHYTICFLGATTIGWGYRFSWEKGNWDTCNSDPNGDFKVEPIDHVVNVEVKAWKTAPPVGPKFNGTGITVNGRKFALPVRLVKTVPATE